jgi:hypothetical protein
MGNKKKIAGAEVASIVGTNPDAVSEELSRNSPTIRPEAIKLDLIQRPHNDGAPIAKEKT